MTATPPLAQHHFPSRIADLGFSAELPEGWVHHELPNEDVDFSDPNAFVPLAVVTAPHAAIVFAFSARPAHDEGSLHDWAWYHLNQQPLQPRTVGHGAVAGVAAVLGEAVQPSELGPMVVRFAFLEDGDRLIQMSLTAPELFEANVQPAWFALLRSFTLETPRGSRFAIEPNAEHDSAAPIPQPWLEPASANPAPRAAVRDAETGEPLLPLNDIADPLAPDAPPKLRIGDFALDADSIALDEDHATNARLRERGIGLVPHIAGFSDRERRATLAAGAIMALFDVPYGWHVIDDGQRTLIFEPSGRIQINLNLLPRQGRDNAALLDAIEAQMRADYAAPEFMRLQQGTIDAIGARNLFDGEQALEQVHMLHAFRDDTMVLRARVTATPEQAINACNLAEMILASCVFEPEPQAPADADEELPPPDRDAPADGRPAWWHEALALEASGALEAAEQHIRTHCPHIGFAYATADLYRLRMHRLQAAGDAAGADDAYRRSCAFIVHYASLATSGGEGMALSAERDAFLAQLEAERHGHRNRS